MPATTKKPIKIVPNTIKTIPKVPLSPISKSKSFQEKLNDIQNNIDINIDDIPEDLLDIWDELQEDITPKLISKNYKLWLTIFTPFILPGIINGMSGKPSVPQPVVTVQEPAPDPKQIVNFAQKYFAEHGLELCKSLTKTDLNNIKQDLINNWGKGPDAFSKAFQDSYPVSKARLENIYRSERHLAEYHGVLERAKIADHKYKQWRAVGDERSCDLCMSHDMETVPINEPFSNGEMTATGHPQCRCSMVTYSDEDYNEMKENSSYLADAFETIKLNYNCPDDEKIGSGPGSCSGGNTSNLDKVSTLKNKIRELEKSVSEGKSTFDEAYEQYKSIQKELDLELEKEKLRNPDNAKITNDIVTDPEPITPYKALSDYQNYAYTAINDYLRKTNYVKQNPQQTKNIQNMIKTIDSEMENNPLKSDKLVFRADNAGISSDAFEKTGLTNIFKDTFGKESLTLEDFIKNHKLIDKIREKLVGYEYTEKAYLSTGSDKENTMNRFLAPSRNISKYGVTGLINLIVPKGTPAIRIADYTGLEDELGGKIDEYLIGRDQTIVIDQVYIRPADDNRLYLEYNAHIKTNEQKQNSEYLEDVTNFIKLNYNCPDSEKIGSGPGSCGGNKPNEKHEPEKPIFDGVPQDLKLGNEFKSAKQAVSRNEFNFKTEKKQGMYDTVYKIRVIPKKIPTEWKNKKDTLDDKNIWYDPTYMKEIPFGNGKSTVVIPINPEIENQMKLPSGKEKGYLFRGMSYEEFEGIKKNGYIKTEAQYNFDFQGDMTFFSDEKSTAANYASGFAPWQYAPTIDKPAIMIKIKDPGNHEKGTTEGEIGIRGKISDELITEVYVGRPVSMVEGYFEIVDDKYNNNVYRGNAFPYKSNVIWEIIPYNKQKQDSSYLEDVTNFIKLNYKCPKGTVDDSNKCDIEKPIVNIPIPNKFKDIDNVKSDKIRGESSEFLNQLVQNNEYLVNSLKSYTNIGHLEVNKYLGNRISGNIPKEIEKIIIGLDSIFNLQKEQNFLTSSSITAYRGVSDIEIENLLGLNQKHIYDIEPGKIITDPKFVSTTLNKEQALQFGRDRYGGSIITILIPKNSEALHTESVSGSEDELLINRNQSYKFLGVNKNIDNSGLDSNKPVHEFIFELVNANQKQSSSHLSDAVETIKLNYNCPDSEKNGSGPGSCGGSNTSSNKPKNDIVSLKGEQKAIKRILLDYNRLSQPKDDSYNQLSNRLKEINKTLDIETPKSVSVDITAPSRSALEKMIQGDPTFDDDPLPWDEDYNVKLGGTLYQIRLEGWYDDCLESRGYDKIDPDKYQDVIQSDFKQIVSDESGWGNSKENIYGYVPNVPGTTYGVTYIGRPIKTKQNSEYLEDATDFIKLNYKCPKGTVDDSNKCNPEEQEKSNTSDSKSASETFIGFKADHDFSSPQDRSAKHVKITTIKAIV